jgi:hypothetical protein
MNRCDIEYLFYYVRILVAQHCGKFYSPAYQIIVYSVYGMWRGIGNDSGTKQTYVMVQQILYTCISSDRYKKNSC